MENLVLDIKLNVNQVNIILAHLGKGAFETVSDVIAEIQRQCTPQVDEERQRISSAPQVMEGEILLPEKAK